MQPIADLPHPVPMSGAQEKKVRELQKVDDLTMELRNIQEIVRTLQELIEDFQVRIMHGHTSLTKYYVPKFWTVKKLHNSRH